MMFFLLTFAMCVALVGLCFLVLALAFVPYWVHNYIEDNEIGPQWLQSGVGFTLLALFIWAFELTLALCAYRSALIFLRS
jgi:hypothetical protein